MFIILIALSLWQNHASVISDSSVNYAHYDTLSGETDKNSGSQGEQPIIIIMRLATKATPIIEN